MNMFQGPQAPPSLPLPDSSSRSPSGSIDLSPIDKMSRSVEPGSIKARFQVSPGSEVMAGVGVPLGRRSHNPIPWALMSFYGSEQPWVPLLSTTPESQQGHVIPSDIQRRGNPAWNDFRSGQPSECGTVPPGCLPSDSGYESRTKQSIENTSIFDVDDADRTQDTQSLSGHMLDFHPFQPSDTPLARDFWNPAPTPIPAAQIASADSKLTCPTCEIACKTKSELKKHNQRHRKAYKCDVPGCIRKEGFGTQNDLERHRSSVHPDRFSGGPRYRCHIGSCQSKEKVWPRADNFRQHLRRVHHKTVQPEEDLSDFVIQSSQKHLQQHVQEDLEGVGSDLFPITSATTPMVWGSRPLALDDVSHEQSTDTNLVLDPSLATVQGSMSTILDAKPMDLDVSGAQLPDQISGQDLKDHPRSACGSKQNQAKYVQPEQISMAASTDDIIISRSSPHSQGSRAHRPKVSVGRGKDFDEDVRDTSQQEESEDPSTYDMESENFPKTTGDRDLKEPSGREQSKSRNKNPEDQHVDQSSVPSSPSTEELDEEHARKVLSRMPINFIQNFLTTQSQSPASKPAVMFSNNTPETQHHCPQAGCNKKFNRKCELKKHMKRHDKPYGCTFIRCKKKFGSKNDWKRHENSQHFQLEVWKCDEKRLEDNSQTCGKVCHRRETFRSHLQREHKVEEAAQADKLEKCRVGRNCDSRFWCGFCVKIIEITGKNANAWAERFNHIDDHYSGRDNTPKKDISEWKNVDPDMPDSEVGITGFSDESSELDSGDETTVVSRKILSHAKSSTARSRKRGVEDDGEQPDPKRLKRMWFCCHCEWYADVKLNDGCVNCPHLRCSGCEESTALIDVDVAPRPNNPKVMGVIP